MCPDAVRRAPLGNHLGLSLFRPVLSALPGRGRMATLGLGLLLGLGSWMLPGLVPAALAVHTDAFELDANAADSPAGAPDDWDNVYVGTSSALRTVFLPDDPEPDFTTFTQGSKDTDPIANWVCTKLNNQNGKADIFNGYAAFYNDAGTLRFYYGADREPQAGNSNFGFWLFQDVVD
jgi:hypothetical protein